MTKYIAEFVITLTNLVSGIFPIALILIISQKPYLTYQFSMQSMDSVNYDENQMSISSGLCPIGA